MQDAGIPNEVKAFVNDHIESVMQLELLLLLHADAERPWTSVDIARELRIDDVWSSGQLAYLASRGIVVATDQPAGAYHFARDPRIAATVTALAKAYTDRRVSVISLIFSKPVDKLKSFSEAFRLRKERPDG